MRVDIFSTCLLFPHHFLSLVGLRLGPIPKRNREKLAVVKRTRMSARSFLFFLDGKQYVCTYATHFLLTSGYRKHELLKFCLFKILSIISYLFIRPPIFPFSHTTWPVKQVNERRERKRYCSSGFMGLMEMRKGTRLKIGGWKEACFKSITKLLLI